MFDQYGEETSTLQHTAGWVAKTAPRAVVSLFVSGVALPLGTFLGARLHLEPLSILVAPGFLLALVMKPFLPPTEGFGGLGQLLAVGAVGDWLFYAAVIFLLYPVIARRMSDAHQDNVN